MVEKTEIGIAEVRLQTNLKGLDKGFDKAEKKTRKRVSTLNKITATAAAKLKAVFSPARIAAGVVAGAAAATAAFVILTRKAITTADEIGKTADVIGLSTDAFQELRFAAEQSGVANQAFTMGMRNLTRGIAEAALGTGELKDVLVKYEISATNANGTTRDTEDVLKDLADATQRETSETDRLLISYRAFGGRASALKVLLRDGAAGMDALRQSARDLGIVIEERLIRQAEKANDTLNELSKSIKANLNAVLLESAPLIVSTGEKLEGFLIKFARIRNALNLRRGFVAIEALEKTRKELEIVEQQIAEARAKAAELLKDNTLFRSGINIGAADIGSSELKARLQQRADLRIKEKEQLKAINEVLGISTKKKEEHAKVIKKVSLAATELITSLDKQLEILKATGPEQERLQILLDQDVVVRKAQATATKEGTEVSKEQIKSIQDAIENIAHQTKANEELAESEAKIQDIQARRESRLKQLIELAKTDAETIKELTAEIQAFIEAGDLGTEQGARALEKLLEPMKEVEKKAKELKDPLEDIKDTAIDFTEAWSRAFADMLVEGEFTFKSLAKSLLKELLSQQIFNLLKQFGGFLGTSLFPGGKNATTVSGVSSDAPIKLAAQGAMARARQPFIVGERGPELFVPSSPGTIVPNDRMVGSAGVEINIFNNTSDEVQVERRQGSDGREILDMVIGRVAQDIVSNGRVGQAIKGRYGLSNAPRGG